MGFEPITSGAMVQYLESHKCLEIFYRLQGRKYKRTELTVDIKITQPVIEVLNIHIPIVKTVVCDVHHFSAALTVSYSKSLLI